MASKHVDLRSVPVDAPTNGTVRPMSEDELREEADAILAQARAEAAAKGDKKLMAAPAAIGSWSDLDWDELSLELDRIRHDRPPPPTPIDLDDLFEPEMPIES